MLATSSSISPRDYASREPSRLLAWTRRNGVSTFNVSLDPNPSLQLQDIGYTAKQLRKLTKAS